MIRSYQGTLTSLMATLSAWLIERVLLLEGTARHGALAICALLISGSILARASRSMSTQDAGHALADRHGVAAQTALILSGILYLWGAHLGPESALSTWLSFGWGVLLISSLAINAATDRELSAPSPILSPHRVRDATMASLVAALSLASLIPLVSAARRHDVVIDLAYARSARPGRATKALVERIQEGPQELVVDAFLAPNASLDEPLGAYFAQLDNVRYTRRDQLLEPARARELEVRHNNVLALSIEGARGQRRTQHVDLGENEVASRAVARDLDKQIQRALRPLARPKRTVYLVQGHGESSWLTGQPSHKRTMMLRDELQPQLNIELKLLDASRGLAMAIPEDAAALVILGPERALLEEEVEAIEQYMDRGGALLLAIEPNLSLDSLAVIDSLTSLLDRFSVKLGDGAIASTRNILPITRSDADRLNLITRRFDPHPAIATLSNPATTMAVLMPSTGYIETIAQNEGEALVSPEPLIRAPRGAWNDLNGDLTFGADGETRQPHVLAAAIAPRQRPGGKPPAPWRAVVVADATLFSDLAMQRSQGNLQLTADLLNWLLDEEELSGDTKSERDVRIVHSRQGEGWIFHGTTFGVPALLLLIGLWRTRRRADGEEQAR